MMLFRKQKPGIQHSRAQALQYVPVKNKEITENRQENGDVMIAYPVGMRPLVAALVKRLGGPHDKTEIKKLQLDELGTATWDLIDGRRSVQQLVKAFAAKYQLPLREAEISITQFIKELGQRGIIGLR